jgi:hypothetical protein
MDDGWIVEGSNEAEDSGGWVDRCVLEVEGAGATIQNICEMSTCGYSGGAGGSTHMQAQNERFDVRDVGDRRTTLGGSLPVD